MLTILKSSCRGATFMNLRQIEGRHRTNRWAVRHSCRLSAAEISATYFRFWHKAAAKGQRTKRWAVRHSCRLSAAEISATYFRFWHKAAAKGQRTKPLA